MLIKRQSVFTGKICTLDIPCTEEQYQKWENGELIQTAMPNLTPDQREFIISGITAEEWHTVFGDDC